MKVLFRKPLNQPLVIKDISNEPKDLQKLIGGYVGVIYLTDDIVCLVDDAGSLKSLCPNFYYKTYWIVGNVIFCGVKRNEFVSLTDEQMEWVSEYIGFPIKK